MKASSDNIRELKLRLKEEYGVLAQRLEEVAKRPVTASQYAVEAFKKLKIPKDIMRMRDIKRVKTLYRDIKYIERLKSATLEGAEKVKSEFGFIEERLRNFTEDNRKAAWKSYQKLYDEAPIIAQFKYEILDVITETLAEGVDINKVLSDMQKRFRESYEKLNTEGRYTYEDLGLSYSRKLRNIRRKYFGHS